MTPVAATGYSGLFQQIFGEGYSTIGRLSPGELTVSKTLRSRGDRSRRRLIRTLNGVAAGGSATESYTRRVAAADQNYNVQGGLIPMEVVNLVNRVTVAQDQTDINTMLDNRPLPSSYPADRSGNGGGGKLGF